jgi:protein kinase-like protein
MGDEVTVSPLGSAPDETRLASTPSHTSSSGWLGAPAAVGSARFAPGELIEGRYRVIALLGRGGMGEVYRADDLRLGQTVALKFLPEALAHDPVRLAQFHTEVRTARQVSHPNVCRVYDIGDASGHLFLTMEYVDGEDLSSLLRRIGRLPEDKALEIARQICAGIAAAHERTVIHRDLKPANVMLDGTGRIRIMDFSLAAVGAVAEGLAGTPAYMAPEQLEGRDATIRSDIYALGLVLYELFTGRRVFQAKTLADLVAQHSSGSVVAPTDIVKSLDPMIEQTILRCLEPDPLRRPASALSVAGALTGTDPLAAALAAGETPSPEMIAAAGGENATLSATAGTAWLATSAMLLVAVAALADRTSVPARIPLAKPVAVLLDRAEDIRRSLGYTEAPVDYTSSLDYDNEYLEWGRRHGSGDTQWRELREGRPAAVIFSYRTSPVALIPKSTLAPVGTDDPALIVAGSTLVVVDTMGRLVAFTAVPQQVEKNPTRGAADWTSLFAAASLDKSAFVEIAPARTPPSYADERRAWQGTLPETKTPVTIEAAAYHGRPVSFEIVAPWTTAAREPHADNGRTGEVQTFIVLALLGIAVVLARVNIRSGRADRRGAFRLASFMFVVYVATWAGLPHVVKLPNEIDRLFSWIAIGLFVGGVMYLVYLAIEPFVRRSWPAMLVGWSRALTASGRDPVIGRDLVVGVAAGLLLSTLAEAQQLATRLLGWPEPIPFTPGLGVIEHSRYFAVSILTSLNNGLQNALLGVLAFTMFREVVRRMAAHVKLRRVSPDTLTAIVTLALLTMMNIAMSEWDHLWVALVYQVASLTVFMVVLLRFGLLATFVMFTVSVLTSRIPLTLRPPAIYAGPAWLTMAMILGVAAAGLWMARGSRQSLAVGR